MATKPTRMRAARIVAPGAGVELFGCDIPEPAPGEVMVRSHAVGICGSDVSMLSGRRPSGFVKYPVVPGHEWSGRIVDVGAGVDQIAPGTPIAVMSLHTCGRCERCRDGHTHLCERGYDEVGFTTPGGLAEYAVIRADQAVPVPPDLGLDEAALLEPAAVVCHAFLRCPPVSGRVVTVIGDGTLGLLAAQVARAHGAAVNVVGLDEHRLKLAAQLGTAAVHRVRPGNGILNGLAPADVVIECAGATGTAQLALGCVRRGGTVAVLGVTGADVPLGVSGDRFVVDDLTVTGILASTPASWNHALRLAVAGRLKLGPLITHRFGFSDVARAFDCAATRPAGGVKILIEHRAEETDK